MLNRHPVPMLADALEAAEKVCTGEGIVEREVTDLLTSRVDKSLVVYEDKEGVGRHRLLETIHQYAREHGEQRAAQLLRAKEALREEIGAPRPPSDREEYDTDVTAARETLGQEAFAAAWAEGRAMTMEQAIASALGELGATSLI